MATLDDDRATLEAMVGTFFAAFATGPDLDARLEALRDLFIPEAVIIRTCGLDPAVYSVDAFIEPRQRLLAGGSLVDFKEWAEAGRTEVFGDVAHWFGSYAKSWTQDGAPFEGRGMKSIQLVRMPVGWRISAAAWDDERP
jgi:hypothetical protein